MSRALGHSRIDAVAHGAGDRDPIDFAACLIEHSDHQGQVIAAVSMGQEVKLVGGEPVLAGKKALVARRG